jgi:hypothetical protein
MYIEVSCPVIQDETRNKMERFHVRFIWCRAMCRGSGGVIDMRFREVNWWFSRDSIWHTGRMVERYFRRGIDRRLETLANRCRRGKRYSWPRSEVILLNTRFSINSTKREWTLV